jgi:signal transduction histidine kinase
MAAQKPGQASRFGAAPAHLPADQTAALAAQLAETRGALERERAARVAAEQELLRLERRHKADHELRQRVAELAALNLVAQAVTLWNALPDALTAVSAIMADLFDTASIAIWLLDEHRNALVRLHAITSEGVASGRLEMALAEDPVAQRVIGRGKAKIVPPSGQSAGLMVLPLQARGAVIGIVHIRAARPEHLYTPIDVALAQTIAALLANAIDNARLFEHARAVAVEEERKRLARDLHDSVNQALFHASLTADVLPELWEHDTARGRRALSDLQRMTYSALAEMRALLNELRPAALASAPLHSLLHSLASAAGAKAGIAVDARLESVPLLPSDVQVAIYRIAQEALHNVVKHARASRVAIALAAAPALEGALADAWSGAITLLIADDGRGCDLDQIAAGRLGLASLRERAADIGATLMIDSRPGAGMRIDLTWKGNATTNQTESDSAEPTVQTSNGSLEAV